MGKFYVFGIPFPIFTTILVILKLTNVIHFSWLWVLAPLWLPSAIWLLVAFVMFLLGASIL